MLQRLRCKICGATLLFHEIEEGVVEIMCRQTKCKTVNRVKCENGVCFVEEKIRSKSVPIAHPVGSVI